MQDEIGKSPLASIVTACYNAEKFIRDLISSVASQTYKNWEMIIIDDFSSDNSLLVAKKAIKEFNVEDKVRLLPQSKNRGYGYTLWNAINHSKGHLVAVVDADDALFDNETLSVVVKYHKKYPEVSMTYSDYMECDGNLQPRSVYQTRQLKDDEIYIDTKIRINHLKVFKRVYYDSTEGVNKGLRRTVDKDLVLKLEEVGNLLHIPMVLYRYRKHSENISRTDHKKSTQEQVNINRARKQIYEDARKRRKQPSNKWLNPEKCKELQAKWGEYDKFITDPNRENKKEVIKVLRKLCSNDKPSVLDVGCGAGHFMWAIKGRTSRLMGLDYSPEMLKLVEEQFKNSKIKPELVKGTCWNIPLPNNHVDLVYQIDVCMHVGGSWESIKDMLRVAKKYVMFTGPSFDMSMKDNEMDKKLGSGKRWAVNAKLLDSKLKELKSLGVIKNFDFKKRIPSSIYKHKILVIEKNMDINSVVLKGDKSVVKLNRAKGVACV